MSNNLLKIPIGDLFDRQAARFGDRDALVHVEYDVRYTYAELHAECDRIAKGLLALGVQKGEHVAIWATNYAEWVVAQFALAKIGAVLVTVNPAYRSHELEYVLRQSDARVLLLIGSFKTSDYLAMLHEVVPELRDSAPGALRSEKLPNLRHVILIPPPAGVPTNQPLRTGMWQWEEIKALGDNVAPAALVQRQALCEPDDVIMIQYTSGTTGTPKGAMLTHLNIVANATYFGDGLHLTEQDRMCIQLPFYHCGGCVCGTLCCVTKGATMVIPGEAFDPVKSLVALDQERCTALIGVPTMFIAELGHPDFEQYDLSSLRTGLMGGSPCPIEVMRQVVDRMGATEMTIGYGLTEAAPMVTLSRSDDTLERRVTTVGPPLPNVEVKIVDPLTGQEVPQGQPGELWTRSFMVMKGYYKMPAATAQAVDAEGWLHTGDVATLDAAGYCKITGRIKDMIIRSGENIYPREIEEFLYTHAQVADVQVIGVPDLLYGEEVMAWIKLKEGQSATAKEIRHFCRGKIAHYKIPRYIKFVTEFPMTVTGKVQKYKLRALAVEELGLQEAARVATA
jgi:fatty-acyl-CoA synthase